MGVGVRGESRLVRSKDEIHSRIWLRHSVTQQIYLRKYEKKQLLNSKNYAHLVIIIPVHTRDTAGTGSGMPQCAKVDNCTRTHATHFGITAGLPVPVPNPILDTFRLGSSYSTLVKVPNKAEIDWCR